MIPLSKGADLGHAEESPNRQKRSLQIGQWKDYEWPPERVIAYYDPASWARDGSYGYRTPIYMLNRIIRLQAVVELLTRENEQALLLLAKQNTKIKNAIYQNRLALDYLLAAEGGVCGKFNLTNCCLEIGDTGSNCRNYRAYEKSSTCPYPDLDWYVGHLRLVRGEFSITGSKPCSSSV